MASSSEKAKKFQKIMAEQIKKSGSRVEEREAEVAKSIEAMFEGVKATEVGEHQRMFSELFFDPVKELEKPDFPVDTFHHLHQEWPEWVRESVPTSDPNYEWNKRTVYDFVVGDKDHTFLVGLPGSGKTSLPVEVAAVTGRPVFIQSFSNDLESDEWLMSKEINDEGTTWHILPFVKFLSYPTYMVLDEFNRLRRGGRLLMNRLLNEGGSMQLRDGTEVFPHAQCRAIATDNTRGMGDGLDKFDGDIADISTTDRFGMMIEVDYLPRDQQLALVAKWVPDLDDALICDIVDFGIKVVSGYKSGSLPLPWTPRRMKRAAEYTLAYRNPVDALRNAYYGFLAEDREREACNQIIKDIGMHRKFGEFA